MGSVSFLFSLFCLFFGVQGCGGGEVSGGGTLYMKWGADNYYCHKRGLWGERKYYYFMRIK
jgi:hypothetical protein